MFFISSIIQAIGGIFTVIGNHMQQYGTPKNVEARRLNDDQKKLDGFREALKNDDLDKIRKDISS